MTTEVITPQVFKYETPDYEGGRATAWLCKSELLRGSVAILKEGGETNLHSHAGNDGFWMVFRGRARFYGEGDVLVADLGPMDGVLIPHGFKYWFESSSEEPLEILHIAALAQNVADERRDYTPLPDGRSTHFGNEDFAPPEVRQDKASN
jgi:mannose-6-phosphate isomerase-like protein (cupin superfamily)